MKNFMVYHPSTGTLISLSDPVYLVDTAIVSEDILDSMEMGGTVDERDHKGYRIDNYNMTNFLFGGRE